MQNSTTNKIGEFFLSESRILIDRIEQNQNALALELIACYTFIFNNRFKSYLKSVNPSKNTIYVETKIAPTEEQNQLHQILLTTEPLIEESFAEAKYLLDIIFLRITEQGKLNYTYNPQLLLTSLQLQQVLGVSRATISRYVEHGMESVAGYGHKRYPKHNVCYWKNGLRASQIQFLYQKFRLRNRTKEDIIAEVYAEIKKLEKKYHGDFSSIFGHVKDPYTLSEPDDYYNWRDFIKELEELTNSL